MTVGESVMVRTASALAECGIAYLVSGSFASNYYGIPRSTKDADFIVQLRHTVGDDFLRLAGARSMALGHYCRRSDGQYQRFDPLSVGTSRAWPFISCVELVEQCA